MTDIVLRDRDGNKTTYEGVDTITVDTPNDEQTTFTHGTLIKNVEIELDMENGDQYLAVQENYLIREATLKRPETLIPENIKQDVNIGGVVGTLIGNGQEKMVDLSMESGDMEILPDEKYMLTKVIVKKPITLNPDNIVKGVDIGGVVGAFETDVELPILNSPTLTKTEKTKYDLYNIQNPDENGSFATLLKCYNNGALVTTKEISGVGGTVEIEDVSLFDGTEGSQTLGFVLSGENFTNSDIVEAETTMYSVNITPESLSDHYDYPAIKGGSDYNITITDKAKQDSGYLSPEIKVTMNGEECEYDWENNVELEDDAREGCYELCRCTSGRLNVPNVTGPLVVDVPTTDKPKLDKPIIKNDGGIVKIIPPDYAEKIDIFVDGELVKTAQGITYEIETEDFNVSGEGSLLREDELQFISAYYLAKIKLVSPEDDYPLKIRYLNYTYTASKQNYAYGMFSKLDTELSAEAVDDDDLLSYNYKGDSAAECREAEFIIPAGEHFITAKKVTVETTSTGNMISDFNAFDFAMTGLCKTAEITLADYKEHTITAIASATTSLDSDVATAKCYQQPVCVVAERILTVSNIIDGVNQIAVYINDDLIDTVDYTGEGWSLDLTTYPYHQADSDVYIKVIGDGLENISQTIKADLSLPAPEITVGEGTLTVTNIVSLAKEIEIYIGDELYGTYESTEGFTQDISTGLTSDKAVSNKNWEVVPVSGATYGFALNTSGYYVSQNKGVNSSYAICRVNINNVTAIPVYIKAKGDGFEVVSNIFNVPAGDGETITATFDCINYAESSYDYGILSTIDNTLLLNSTADSSNVYKSFKGLSKSSVQSVTYSIPNGEHFVYVKYRKDSSTHSNNDTLQFKVALT